MSTEELLKSSPWHKAVKETEWQSVAWSSKIGGPGNKDSLFASMRVWQRVLSYKEINRNQCENHNRVLKGHVQGHFRTVRSHKLVEELLPLVFTKCVKGNTGTGKKRSLSEWLTSESQTQGWCWTDRQGWGCNSMIDDLTHSKPVPGDKKQDFMTERRAIAWKDLLHSTAVQRLLAADGAAVRRGKHPPRLSYSPSTNSIQFYHRKWSQLGTESRWQNSKVCCPADKIWTTLVVMAC